MLENSSQAQQVLVVDFPKRKRVYINLQLLLPSSLKTTLESPKTAVVAVLSDQCHFKSEKCHACGKQGHISRVCQSKKKLHPSKNESRSQPTNQVIELTSSTTDYILFPVSTPEGKPLQTTIDVENHPFVMEIDTGAAVSLINETTYKSSPFLSELPLQSLMVQLRTYTGETISVTGEILVKVQSGRQSHTLPLLVVPGQGPSLLGRNWLLKLQLDWKNICSLHSSNLQGVLDHYSSLFQEGLGILKQTKVKFFLKEGTTPKFYKTHPVPLALQQRVAAELDRLQAEGILCPIKVSDWATPIVPVMKKDGTIRVCGDFKLTVNQATQTEMYPLPRIDEPFASLSDGTVCFTLDLSHACNQLLLDEQAQELTTINTHKGLYKYCHTKIGPPQRWSPRTDFCEKMVPRANFGNQNRSPRTDFGSQN